MLLCCRLILMWMLGEEWSMLVYWLLTSMGMIMCPCYSLFSKTTWTKRLCFWNLFFDHSIIWLVNCTNLINLYMLLYSLWYLRVCDLHTENFPFFWKNIKQKWSLYSSWNILQQENGKIVFHTLFFLCCSIELWRQTIYWKDIKLELFMTKYLCYYPGIWWREIWFGAWRCSNIYWCFGKAFGKGGKLVYYVYYLK